MTLRAFSLDGEFARQIPPRDVTAAMDVVNHDIFGLFYAVGERSIGAGSVRAGDVTDVSIDLIVSLLPSTPRQRIIHSSSGGPSQDRHYDIGAFSQNKLSPTINECIIRARSQGICARPRDHIAEPKSSRTFGFNFSNCFPSSRDDRP
jgi:hypothetical protein